MMVYLNDDTFNTLDWCNEQKIRQLILLCGRLGVRHVVAFTACLPYVSAAIRCAHIHKDIRDKMRSLFTRPYAKCNIDSGKSYRIQAIKGTGQLPGGKLAWSYSHGGILVGLPQSKYGDSFKYLVNEYRVDDGMCLRQFYSYMVSTDAHLDKALVKRWQYAYRSVGDVDFTRNQKYVQLPPDYIKHFVRVRLNKEEWLNSTKDHNQFGRDKTCGVAKFIVDIQKDSLAYAYLISAIIRTAFEHQVYEEEEQNGLTVDVGRIIGATNGKETKIIILYVTNGTVVHIRPCERCAKIIAPEIGDGLMKYCNIR